ncbi:MAG: hypothetical protein JSV24_11665, partial [Bacteroidales bacterium]
INMKDEQKIKDLEKRIKELEALVRSKEVEIEKIRTVFLSNISHEIRTPMNSIIGFSNLLASDDLSTDQKDLYLEYINNSSENLLSFIENLIDMAMIESGQLEIHEDDCCINDLFNALYTFYNREKHRKEKHSVALLMDKQVQNTDLLFRTDPLRLKQIMSNLIANALKFTEKGIIVLGYDLSQKNFIKFFVKDTGRGVDQEDGRDVFGSFNRKYSLHQEEARGIGIGLSICKGLVELMGGEIWVEPNIKKGSVFAFQLPKKVSKNRFKPVHFLKEDESMKNFFISDQEVAI